MKAGLPENRISEESKTELDRRCCALRFLYLLAMKNIAAPYAAAPPIAPKAMPAVVPFVPELLFCESVLKTPLLPVEVDVGEDPVPVPPADPSANVPPGISGMAGLTYCIIVKTLLSGFS